MKNLHKFIFPAILISVAIFLCVKNYSPGTYLIGWDSLHPEFNFSEAFRRILEGVWRVEQGVGAIGAHADVADLPRVVFLWLSSFILPISFLRYLYTFVCLVVGPLGLYLFLKYVFQKEKESSWVYLAAFLGSLFYLLNLGTLQNFYVPLEMFPTAFAFTPWLFYLGLMYLREGGKRNLILFSLVTILSSPMAYAATLWYSTFTGVFIFLASYLLISSARKLKFKRLFILGGVALFLNLYWILPNVYSIVNQSKTIANADINRLFSPEAFLRNRDYGDFKDIVIQKNFLFSWRNFDFQNNQFTDLLSVWLKYLANPIVLLVGYVLSGVSVLGLFLGVIKREKVNLALIPTLVFTLFFLININPPSGGLYAFFYDNFQVFSEGFRMPFTKFSILYELLASFYFGYFAFIVLTKRSRYFIAIKALFVVGVVAALIYFMLPAFNGWLVAPSVRRPFPDEYKHVFDWFKASPRGRIALFPINSKYGWEYRNWGYEGSGFVTYGVANPILYRDFDRWNNANEDFFSQASFSLYSKDTPAFLNTLKKYQVRYLLLDESIINPGGTLDVLKIPELKTIFNESGIKQINKYGFLSVYDTGYGQEISTPLKFFETKYDASYSLIDNLYPSGSYIRTEEKAPARSEVKPPTTTPAIIEDLSINRGFSEAYNCDLKKIGKVFKTNSSQGILYRAEGGGASCDYLPYPNLEYGQAYVLRVTGDGKEGRGLKIYLFNEDSQVPELEEILPSGKFDESFFVNPKNASGSGYILNLETRSFGRMASENLLSRVEFYKVDNDYLSNLKGTLLSSKENTLKVLAVHKYGSWAREIDIQGSGLIQLDEGYERGWVGLAKIGNSLIKLDHAKVNSWANGWLVPDGVSKIYIFYWPQLLEWGGMILGLITLVVLWFVRLDTKTK